MQCFARAMAVTGMVLIALPAKPAKLSAFTAERWQLSQSTNEPAATEPTATAPQGQPADAEHGTAATGGDTATTENGTPATVIDDREVEGILGKSVRSNAGEDMGQIIDVIVKRDGQVRAAVIDFGGFLGVGSRKIAVEWGALRFPPDGKLDHVILDLTKDQVRVAPEYRPGEPVVVLGSAGTVQPGPETATPAN
jgi:PRC-barrel domain protein